MVVISATVCDKKGKILVGRQFVDISKLKMEEYISTFPKLIESDSQWTHVETDSVRYVYLPIEDLYLVLITNKNSNIIEDTEIVRQMQKIILKIWNKGINATQISKHAFDLIFSFDDLITLNGYRDSVTMAQLDAYLTMDSTDEKMHKKMRMIREKEAKEIAKKQQKEIAKKAKIDAKSKRDHPVEQFEDETFSAKPKKPMQTKLDDDEPSHHGKSMPGKGMQLGKPKKIQGASGLAKGFGIDENKANFFTPKEEEKVETPEVAQAAQKVVFSIKEIVNCEVTKFGDVWKFNIKGTVAFSVEDTGEKVTQIEFIQPRTELFKQFKVHPEIDKNAWKDRGVLLADDQEMGFATGANIDAIIYKYAAEEEAQLPFEFNIFSTKAAGGKTKVSLELEYTESSEPETNKLSYQNITVIIMVTDEPKLLKIDNSTSNFDKKSGMIMWMTEALSEEAENPVLQFYTTSEEDTMFPLKVSYQYEGQTSKVEKTFLSQMLM